MFCFLGFHNYKRIGTCVDCIGFSLVYLDDVYVCKCCGKIRTRFVCSSPISDRHLFPTIGELLAKNNIK